MKKKTILTLWIIGFIIALIGAGMFVPALIAAANHCTINQFGKQDCSLPITDPRTAIGLIGAVLLLIGVVVVWSAWIGALIRSAIMRTWGWFVILLICLGLSTPFYVLVGLKEQSMISGIDLRSASPH